MSDEDLSDFEWEVIEEVNTTFLFDWSKMTDGSYEPATPTILKRNDGKSFIYPGRTHWLYGGPKVGKSFVAMFAVAEVLKGGGQVLYIDYEMMPSQVWAILVTALGVDPAVVVKNFHYHRVSHSFDGVDGYIEALDEILETPYELAVIDGVNKALQLESLNPNDNMDVNRWLDLLPNRVCGKSGAAVVCLDHANQQGKLLGSVAKAAGVTGALYKLTANKGRKMGKGRKAELNIELDGEREGAVSEIAETVYQNHTFSHHQMVGRIMIDATDPDGRLTYEIVPYPPAGTDGNNQRKKGDKIFDDSKHVACSAAFEAEPKRLFSKNGLLDSEHVKGSKQDVYAALDTLIEVGCVETVQMKGSKFPKYRYIKPYVANSAIVVQFGQDEEEDEQL